MKTDIQFSPAFAMATVHPDPGEEVQAEAGAMMAMTQGIEIETSTRGGMFKGLQSALGGESFFLNTFRATQSGDHVIVAAALPGDVMTWPLRCKHRLPLIGFPSRRARLHSRDSKWGGSKTFFWNEGVFMLKCSGGGDLVVSSYGAIHSLELAPVSPISSTQATWSAGTKE